MSASTEEASELQARESGMAIGFRKCWRSQWQSACCGCCRDVEEGHVEVQIADGVSADVVVGGRKCWRGGALLPAIAVIPVIRINSTDPCKAAMMFPETPSAQYGVKEWCRSW
ncbi:hypothetical protein F5887DRAFT_922503 [Amanita rubescens]|nr:hypothetical protein F5887DRAFT_922503 [Amanita rubescens]